MNEQLLRIGKAYDLTAAQFAAGIEPRDSVPGEIKILPGYDELVEDQWCSSAAPDIKEYLDPKEGMCYLDAGCCANLANYRLHVWPSVYYGVDISPALIGAMRAHVEKHRISIGGLYHTDITSLPFGDEYFDIATVIGVLEYYTLEYTTYALKELCRALKQNAKMVVDIANLEHPYVDTMFRLEEHYGRPLIHKKRNSFESLLKTAFITDNIDDSRVMLKYFVRRR